MARMSRVTRFFWTVIAEFSWTVVAGFSFCGTEGVLMTPVDAISGKRRLWREMGSLGTGFQRQSISLQGPGPELEVLSNTLTAFMNAGADDMMKYSSGSPSIGEWTLNLSLQSNGVRVSWKAFLINMPNLAQEK